MASPAGSSATVARVGLSLDLRQAREAAGMTQEEIAKEFDWSVSKVIRFENGMTALGPLEVVALVRRYGLTDDRQIERYRDTAQRARRHGDWSRSRDHLNRATRDLMDLEAAATIIRTLQTMLVPGPLQTKELAEFILNGWSSDMTEEGRKTRLEARLSRFGRIFDDTPPDYRLILDESVLHRTLGAGPVFSDQLASLLERKKQGLVQLRVAPFSMLDIIQVLTPFILLTLNEDQTVLYRETHLDDEVVLRPETVGQHMRLFDHMWDHGCYSDVRSERLIRSRMHAVLAEEALEPDDTGKGAR